MKKKITRQRKKDSLKSFTKSHEIDGPREPELVRNRVYTKQACKALLGRWQNQPAGPLRQKSHPVFNFRQTKDSHQQKKQTYDQVESTCSAAQQTTAAAALLHTVTGTPIPSCVHFSCWAIGGTQQQILEHTHWQQLLRKSCALCQGSSITGTWQAKHSWKQLVLKKFRHFF